MKKFQQYQIHLQVHPILKYTNYMKKIGALICGLILCVAVAVGGLGFSPNAIGTVRAENGTPTPIDLTYTPLFNTNTNIINPGINFGASQQILNDILSIQIGGEYIDLEDDIVTMPYLFDALGLIRLFETVGDNHIEIFTSQLWRPVYLRDGILTLWMEGGYRTTTFTTAGMWGPSVLAPTLEQDFATVLGNFHDLKDDFLVNPHGLPYFWHDFLAPGGAPANIPIDSNARIFIPSDSEVNNVGLWGFTNNSQRVVDPLNLAPGVLQESWVRNQISATAGRAITLSGAFNNPNPVNAHLSIRPALHIDITGFLTEQLDAPTLILNDTTLTYTAPADTTVILYRNGTRHGAITAPFDVTPLLQLGDNNFTALAVSTNQFLTDSDFSLPVTYTRNLAQMPKPLNVRIVDGYVMWDAVTGADTYAIYVNGELFVDNITATQFSMTAIREYFTTQGTHTITVRAIGEDLGEIIYSGVSEAVSFTVGSNNGGNNNLLIIILSVVGGLLLLALLIFIILRRRRKE